MLNKEEIEKRLQGVDPQLCVAFAARCSLRVLPLLVASKKKEVFWYWDRRDQPRHVLALLIAQQVSMNFSAFGREINIAAAAVSADADDAYAAAYIDDDDAYADDDAVASATRAAAVAAYAAAAYANRAAYARAAYARAAAAYAAYAAAYARTNINLESIILLDLDTITNDSLADLDHFIYSPLWQDSPPSAWQVLLQRFLQELIDLDSSFSIWAEWYQDRIDGVHLKYKKEQKWLDVAGEVKAQGTIAVNNYLATLSSTQNNEQEALKPLNLVRALFIGNGAAGKTSLIRKLHNEEVVEGKEKMTPGIEIREWSLPDSAIKARFWDFGGQVMTHATHQFFLHERCLYVLVVDAGSERDIRDGYKVNEQAEYWLDHIKAFGNSAPVMLVGNKSDRAKVNLDMNALVEKYPNIIDFFPISCTSQQTAAICDFDKFQAILIEQLKAIKTHEVMFTPNQFAMLEKIRADSRQQAFLSEDEFDNLCTQYEIGKEGLNQQAFLGLLGALGEVVHFSEREWSDMYVLNPRWLTYGVYTLLYSAEAEIQQGILSYVDVVRILQAKRVMDEQGNVLTYPKGQCRYIVDAMSDFKLCYRLENNGKSHYVIPDKLPEEQPDLSAYFNKSDKGTLAFEFAFTGLLPRTIMPNLIVTRHNEILPDKHGKQLVWQRGVIFHNKEHQARARWQVDYRQNTLQLWVQGQNAREYLVILRDQVDAILKSIKGLSFREYVILPETARVDNDPLRYRKNIVEKASYDRLLKEARRGRKTTSSDSGTDYYVEKVMGFIMTEEQQIKEQAGNVYHATYHIDKADVVGGVGDHHQTNPEINHPTDDTSNSSDTHEPKLYQQWWVITAVVAVVAGLLTGWALNSVIVGGLTSIIAGLVFYTFNPKRRFLRAAWFVLGTAGFSALPSASVTFGLNPQMLNEKFGFLFKWGEPANPWLIFALIVLAGVLFILDAREQ